MRAYLKGDANHLRLVRYRCCCTNESQWYYDVLHLRRACDSRLEKAVEKTLLP